VHTADVSALGRIPDIPTKKLICIIGPRWISRYPDYFVNLFITKAYHPSPNVQGYQVHAHTCLVCFSCAVVYFFLCLLFVTCSRILLYSGTVCPDT
jgi:hypothetical protein